MFEPAQEKHRASPNKLCHVAIGNKQVGITVCSSIREVESRLPPSAFRQSGKRPRTHTAHAREHAAADQTNKSSPLRFIYESMPLITYALTSRRGYFKAQRFS